MFKAQSVETRVEAHRGRREISMRAAVYFWRALVAATRTRRDYSLTKLSQRLTLVRLERWPGTVSLGLPAFMDKDGTQPEVHWNLECTETSKRHILTFHYDGVLHSCGHRVDTRTCASKKKVLLFFRILNTMSNKAIETIMLCVVQ